MLPTTYYNSQVSIRGTRGVAVIAVENVLGNQNAFSVGFRIHWLDPKGSGKTSSQLSGILGMTLNFVKWRGLSSEELGSLTLGPL